MRSMRWRPAFCLVAVVASALLVSCGSHDSHSATPTSTPETQQSPAEAPLPRGTQSPTLIALQRDYEVLSDAHEAMMGIWENLAAGQTAQCGQYPDLVAPGSISAEGEAILEPLAEALRQAAIGLNTSVDLWKAECLKLRTTTGSDVINQGRLSTRAAGDALRIAAPLLSDVQAR